MDGVELTLHAKCSASERRYLLYNLRAILQELLHNVQEHAYPQEPIRLAALYARYRQGGAVLSSENEKNLYKICADEERKYCKMTNADWLNARRGCLEVFFLDRGVGLVNHFKIEDVKNPLNEAMHKIFLEGKSNKPLRRTEYGGLYLLHTLMKRSNDYVRVLDNTTWYGSSVPFNRANMTVTKPSNTELGITGLAYHLRLSWKASTEDTEIWQTFDPSEAQRVLKELSRTAKSCNELFKQFERCYIWDERFGNVEPQKNTSKHILWLPKPHQMKWDIINRLEFLAKTITDNCLLIIADIPSIEAAMYKAALSNSNFHPNENWSEKFKSILLVTNRWAYAYATHQKQESGFHGFSIFNKKGIPAGINLGFEKQAFKDLTVRQIIVHLLKWHDSICLWQEIYKNKRLFLAEKVLWNEDKIHETQQIIDGYLDFPATTHNQRCALLYRMVLGRIFGLMDEHKTELVPVDSLANSVVHDVNFHEIFNPPEHGSSNIKEIAVGSVLVSGSTLKAVRIKEHLHCLIHQDHKKNKEDTDHYPALFHWIPISAIEQGDFKLERIGKTSEIAPKGWLSIEIPRYDDSDPPKPCGKSSPQDSYNDWQNSGPVYAKLGHWCYEGHHDLITINIPDIVEDAFTRNKPLADFLICEILPYLSIDKNQLTREFKKYPDQTVSSGLLIYRSHPSSERILARVLDCIKEEYRSIAKERIFPILPLRARFGGSTLLVPPRIKKEIKESNHKKEILIFDDASISGRTLQDLRATLKDIGIEKIQYLLIANRLRLPSESRLLRYYWRLDVPTMGREGNCSLCHGLSEARSFSKQLVENSFSSEALKRWLSEWSAVSPLNKWDAGLNSMPIPLQEKKYCYRETIDKHLATIQIYRSIGLTIHAAEIHAMTARDDYGLNKIREQTDAAVKVELAASQLLLFGNELDQNLIYDFIVEGLMMPLSELPNKSPVASLAVLVIMRSLTTLTNPAKKAIAEIAEKNLNQLIQVNHGLILMAYFLVHDLLKRNDSKYYAANRLLSTRHSTVAEKLRSLFRETLSAKGNAHSEPIPRLIDCNDDISNLISGVLDSLASIKDIISELSSSGLARHKPSNKTSEESKPAISTADTDSINKLDYQEKKTVLFSSIKKAIDIIKEFRCGTQSDDASIKIKNALIDVQKNLNEIADCYFHRIDPKENPKGHSFKNAIENIWNQTHFLNDLSAKSDNPNSRKTWVIKHSNCSAMGGTFGHAEWVWIPWHKHIEMIMRDLLLNVICSSSMIRDPWDGENTTEADMWVNIQFSADKVCIYIANACKKNPVNLCEEIRKGTEYKTRWTSLTELQGTIKLETTLSTEDRIVLELSIPYAPYVLKPEPAVKLPEELS